MDLGDYVTATDAVDGVGTYHTVIQSDGSALNSLTVKVFSVLIAAALCSDTLEGGITNANLVDTGDSTSSVVGTAVLYNSSASTGVCTSTLRVGQLYSFQDNGNATDNITNTQLHVSNTESGVATSTVTGVCAYDSAAVDTAVATSTVAEHTTLICNETAIPTDSAVIRFTLVSSDTGLATDSALYGSTYSTTITESGLGSSAAYGHSAYHGFLGETGYADDMLRWQKLGHAIVMNRANGALSRYSGLDILGMFDYGDKTLVVLSDGFYYMGDSGNVPSSIAYGETDLGRSGEFRVENLWVDVTDGVGLTATLSTLGASPTTQTYPIENRVSSAERTTRFVPGRGMYGRFWKLSLSSELPYTVYGLSADIAESRRRV